MSWGEYRRLRLLGLSRDEIECGLFRTGPWFESAFESVIESSKGAGNER